MLLVLGQLPGPARLYTCTCFAPLRPSHSTMCSACTAVGSSIRWSGVCQVSLLPADFFIFYFGYLLNFGAWCLESEGISRKQWPRVRALFLGENESTSVLNTRWKLSTNSQQRKLWHPLQRLWKQHTIHHQLASTSLFFLCFCELSRSLISSDWLLLVGLWREF